MTVPDWRERWETQYSVRSGPHEQREPNKPWPAELIVERWETNGLVERLLAGTRRYVPAGPEQPAGGVNRFFESETGKAVLAKVILGMSVNPDPPNLPG